MSFIIPQNPEIFPALKPTSLEALIVCANSILAVCIEARASVLSLPLNLVRSPAVVQKQEMPCGGFAIIALVARWFLLHKNNFVNRYTIVRKRSGNLNTVTPII